MESLLEIQSFMKIDSRLDLKSLAVTDVLALTGSPEGRSLIYDCPQIIHSLLCLSMDFVETIAKDALLAIVNISADETGAKVLLHEATNLVNMCTRFILDEESPLADAWAMVLSNVSRPEHLIESVLNDLLTKPSQITDLVSCFTRIDFNKKKCNLNYLGPIFSNIGQSSTGRILFCNKETDLLQRLLPFLSHENTVRRGGIIGLLKNICFDSSRHDWLLHELNVLPYLLLPLAGPEEFSDEDNEMFPVELQYLDADKQREADPDLRKILLESLSQLCATRKARDYLRTKGTYEILRELHKFECSELGDQLVLLACENVVDILIRTEEEIGEDNLKELSIPGDLEDKFNTEI